MAVRHIPRPFGPRLMSDRGFRFLMYLVKMNLSKFSRFVLAALFLVLLYLILSHGGSDGLLGIHRIYRNSLKLSPCERFPHKIGIKELKKFPVEDEDEALVDYVRCHHLFPPSTKPYPDHVRFARPSEFNPQLSSLLGNKKGGFFIECGANDGVYLSNTLVLERDQNWGGLLVEANPQLHPALFATNRRAWISDVCLSPDNTVQERDFFVTNQTRHQWETGIGKIDMEDDIDTVFQVHTDQYSFKHFGMVRCFPLILLLKALKVDHVDYFSLDVQGVELKILKTLPFDNKVKFDVINAEFILDPEGKTAMEAFMKSKGYKTHTVLKETFIFTRA